MSQSFLSIQEPAAPRFDVPVPMSGYRWWYLDGLAEDGRQGIVVIAFIGSVFSPYYFAARRKGPTNPEHYCAINIGLYRPGGKRWAMTERGSADVGRGPDWFSVGPSALRWRDDALEVTVRERSMPIPRSLIGRIVVTPNELNGVGYQLDRAGDHTWRPIAPSARIDVRFEQPKLAWTGTGYLDTNAGPRTLEHDFAGWNWSRRHDKTAAEITYAVTERDGYQRALALRCAPGAAPRQSVVPALTDLPPTGWRIRRPTRTDGKPEVLETLEDTPFYARSVLLDQHEGEPVHVMHEALSLTRFQKSWVRGLLPFRMPRVARR